MNTQWYGWKPDLPDFRDYKYVSGITGNAPPSPLPDSVDLRTTGFLPPVFDQGQIGSCTANAIAAMFYFVDRRQTRMSFLGSRLFIYYNERAQENTVEVDAGAQLRSGIKSIVTQGVCLEYLWPYHPELFATQPPEICYTDAKQHNATVYRSVNQTASDLKSCLAEGYPVVCGITVYDSFESDVVAASGVVPMPEPTEAAVGGHAILLVGYNDGTFTAMNSWGADWGMKGFFTIPQDYLLNPDLAADFWMVHAVE